MLALRGHKGKPVSIVRGQRSYEMSGAKDLIYSHLSNQLVSEWSNFSPNPSFPDLRAGLAIAGGIEPSLIIGAGGGSALDLAKTTALLWNLDPAAQNGTVLDGAIVGKRESQLTGKSQILDELIELTRWHRDHARVGRAPT